ncbi:DNA polymerase III subunit alpha [Chitinimonas koreensis]|uniref:DNA polymerase III subunit alpha n=1 Tax=Chitinimonas koreensis TaxID=356302 RepID=UPI0004201507|nr:DNA polymerase III subunit alpha [Chitinimonas koreensis]
MSAPAFIHLRFHSEFSVTDGIVRIDDAVKLAKKYAMPALGISDLMNLFGMVKHYKAARGSGMKPIAGVDAWIENEEDRDKPFRVLLIAKDRAGYGRLCELVTEAFRRNQYRGRAELKREWIAAGDNSALIALSGAHLGDVGQALLNGNREAATAAARWWSGLFPDSYYLELQRTGDPRCEPANQGALDLAVELGLPVVATHPIQFLAREDFKAHEARVCIAEGYVLADKRRPRNFTEEQYFKSPEEMAALFHDVPEALENTVEIARRCNLTVVLGKNYLPLFPTPDGMSLDDFLVYEARNGLEERLAHLYPDPAEREARRPEYEARLKFECDTIIKMGFPGYFLIVADFINWGKQNGCPVGPGRGSGAGSLVAYALKITDLDPLKYALLFERFLNPERVSMPDFDVDFCQENRWRVIEYTRRKYGEEAVSQIATFGTMSSKAVLRDVGRVLDLPFFLCDKLSKLIPLEANKPVSLEKAMEMEPQIRELIEAEDAGELLELAEKLEDLTRGIGMHAGGVLIAPGKLTDFCPLYIASGEGASPVSMYDKDDVEQIGLVKFDFLGLRNLTIIELAQKYIKDLSGEDVDVAKLPLDDAPAYKVFAAGNTTAVFQFESSGMKKMLIEAKPSQFEEIIAFVALYRPGPMDLIPDFTRRMHGEKFEYLHPLLEPVLAPTYGIMVYQEQVMQAAQVCGGYSLGGADLLRRAMGKKKVEEMVAQRAMFVEGAGKNGIDEAKANEIFDYMEKFAGYGFNKSHAAAYALVAYHTAWLKAHHCAAYMAATMSTELDNTDQLKVFYDDCALNNVKFLPPDVNEGFYRFVPVTRREIRYALGAIKGTGEAAVEHIVAVRKAGGPFKDIFDFCERTDKKIVNRRVIEALIRGGAFDSISDHRASLLATVGLALEAAEQAAANANQGGLFDAFEPEPEHQMQMVDVPRWDESVKLAEEKVAIGFYLSGHPFTAVARSVRPFAKTELSRLSPRKETQWVTGVVMEVRVKIGQRGKMAWVTLDDATAKRDVMVYSEALEDAKNKIREDALLVMEVKVSEDTYGGGSGLRISAERILDLAEARSRFARALALGVNGNADVGRLKKLVQPFAGGACPVRIDYRNERAACAVELGEEWRVTLRDELLSELREWLGPEAVKVQF